MNLQSCHTDARGLVTDTLEFETQGLSAGRATFYAYDADDNVVSETTVADGEPTAMPLRFRDFANRDGGYVLLVDGATNAAVSYTWGMDGHLASPFNGACISSVLDVPAVNPYGLFGVDP